MNLSFEERYFKSVINKNNIDRNLRIFNHKNINVLLNIIIEKKNF
jgi:hypothetical protein